jgi:hypothetical protein
MFGKTIAANKCSRAGCQNLANTLLYWRNPKIHDESRTKVWACCEDHYEFLVDYLDSRGFLIEALPIEDRTE